MQVGVHIFAISVIRYNGIQVFFFFEFLTKMQQVLAFRAVPLLGSGFFQSNM